MADNFDLRDALMDKATGIPDRETIPLRPSGSQESQSFSRRRPKLVVDTKLEPAPPLLKDRNFLVYQFWGLVGALLTLEAILILLLYLNIHFSLVWLGKTFQLAFIWGLLIQIGVALCEQHLPRTKRFFYRVELHELWRVVRWIVWPLLFVATLFDVYSTASGLHIEVFERTQYQANLVGNSIYTIAGGLIALAPEPLLIITTLAIVRLLKKQRRTLALKK